MELTHHAPPLKITLLALPMPPIAPMLFVRPPLVKLYQTVILLTVPQTHLLPNASTQPMQLTVIALNLTVLLPSVETPSMELTQIVLRSNH